MTDLPPPPPPGQQPLPGPGVPPPPDAGELVPPSGDPPWPPRPPTWRHNFPDPPDAFHVPWRTGFGVAMVGWTLVGQVAVAVVAGLVAAAMGESLDGLTITGTLGLTVVAQLVVLGGLVGFLLARRYWSWRILGPVQPSWLKHLFTGSALGVAGFFIVTIIVIMVALTIEDFQPPEQFALSAAEGGIWAIVFGYVAVVVLAPLLEEVVFRGLLFQAMRARLGLWPAMVLSSFIWGLVHIELYLTDEGFQADGLLSVMTLVLLGIWFAAVFHQTGSLVVPIVGHAVYNAIAFSLSLIPPEVLERLEEFDPTTAAEVFVPVLGAVTGAT